MPDKISLKKDKLILIQSLRSFRLLGPVAFGSVVRQNIVVGVYGGSKAALLHGGWETKRKGGGQCSKIHVKVMPQLPNFLPLGPTY
jgi:hypothetical protein